MPPLSAVPPVGVFPAFMTHQQPVRLEFGEAKSGTSDVVDLATARPMFVLRSGWASAQVCKAAQRPTVLLSVYARTLSSAWDVKGDKVGGHRPHLFYVKCSHWWGPTCFIVRFKADGQQVEWLLEEDRVRLAAQRHLHLTQPHSLFLPAGQAQHHLPQRAGCCPRTRRQSSAAVICRLVALRRHRCARGGPRDGGGPVCVPVAARKPEWVQSGCCGWECC